MTSDAQKYEKLFSGTKEVAENLKIDASKLQPWIDAHVPGAGSIKSIEQFVVTARASLPSFAKIAI